MCPGPFRECSLQIVLVGRKIYTEQMDAEGLGRRLLLTPSGDPRTTPGKQTVGTVTASQKMLSLQALSSFLNAGPAKGGCLGRGEAPGRLRQSVPQNGRVRLHILEKILAFWARVGLKKGDSDCKIVNFTLPGLRFHVPPDTSVFLPRPLTPLHAPFLARPRPVLARPRPFLTRSSPGLARPHPALARPSPTLVSSNPAVKTGKREI